MMVIMETVMFIRENANHGHFGNHAPIIFFAMRATMYIAIKTIFLVSMDVLLELWKS